mgnify:CR=1 FL=1
MTYQKPLYTSEAFKALMLADPVQLQGALLGYLAETEHNSCEGFTRADLMRAHWRIPCTYPTLALASGRTAVRHTQRSRGALLVSNKMT